MVVRVPGSVYRSDCRALDTEDLGIGNWLLVLRWRVLEDRIRKMGVEAEKVRHTSGVVSVPVCEQHMRQRDRGIVQCSLDQARPFRNSLAGIDDESLAASSDNVRICSLEGELDRLVS